jgi:phosphoglycolate phosphatase-like HAD superfamily hydrolase
MFAISPQHDFLVAIDSDGCVFDTMELKHKECFIPEFINHYELQAVSKYARECWEFANLYSKSRGANRFATLIESLRLLKQRPEVAGRGVRVEIPESVVSWIATETKLGNPALEAKVAATGDAQLTRALHWSKAVNQSIAAMVRGVPPFPLVREVMQRLHGSADILVCSATPCEALRAEWREHELEQYVVDICGQEVGAKKEVLSVASKYAPQKTLMVGDAPGDYAAAAANHCLFFPIIPGDEEASWKRLHDEAVDRFLTGRFAGEYQQQLLEAFERSLPETPPWERLA